MPSDAPVLELSGASLRFGDRTLWSGLDLSVRAGEFIAVLGANGSGKTSLLKAILGLQPLTGGTVSVSGQAAATGNPRVGYIPQQRLFPPETPLRGRDLVGLGVDGHRFGVGLRGRERRRRVDDLVERVGAAQFADKPLGLLSGGEQQRLRAAQALASDPVLLLCDEPLLSLDLHHQRAISSLINEQTERGRAVMFVTHEINPIIDHVDRVLYLAGGSFSIGTPDEVLRSDVLSRLYGSRVDVVRVGGRVIVAGAQDSPHHEHHVDEDVHGDEVIA
jgi:zinc/manganese transport system ATP-binding protein